jgi:hypothetical protein
MTTSLSLSDIAPELRAGPRQFERWRRVRQPGDRIPDRLWKTAVAEARRHGVSHTANLLHLEDGKLEQPITGRALARSHRHRPPSATGSGDCTVEIEGPCGRRVRVWLRGAPMRIWWRWRRWYEGSGL